MTVAPVGDAVPIALFFREITLKLNLPAKIREEIDEPLIFLCSYRAERKQGHFKLDGCGILLDSVRVLLDHVRDQMTGRPVGLNFFRIKLDKFRNRLDNVVDQINGPSGRWDDVRIELGLVLDQINRYLIVLIHFRD